MENTIYKKTQLGLVPSEWEEIVFRDIFEEVSETTNDTERYPLYSLTIEDGVTPKSERYERSFLITKETDSYKVVRKDEFVYNPMNLRFGALARLKEDKEVAVSGYYNVFKVKPGYSPEFMDYYLKSERMMYLYNAYATGSLKEKQRVHYSQFIQFQLPLPSKEEAKRITEILTKWDKAIELKEKLIEQKKEQKKELMQKLISGETRFSGFDAEWQEFELGKIGFTYNGLTGKSADDFGEGKPYIPYKTIFDNSKIDLNKIDFVRINQGEKQNSAKKGDIFFTTSSETPNEVGMTSVLLDDIDEIYLNSFCFGYRLNDFNILSPSYAQFYFRSNEFRRKVYVLAQGSTRFNISKNEVMKITIKIPNVKEQEYISKVLSESDKEIQLLKNQVRELKSQKQGLMKQLLTGKIRVKV